MIRVTVALIIFGCGGLAAGAGNPSTANIQVYREVAALLRSTDQITYRHRCGGVILNNRAVITAGRCVEYEAAERWRFRVGSASWNSGGIVYSASQIILYEDYDEWAMLGDLAIVRTGGNILLGGNIQPGSFSGPQYVVAPNESVSTTGWTFLSFPLLQEVSFSDLHQLEQTNLDLATCRPLYSTEGFWLANTTLCTISYSQDNRNKCFGEPGSPLYHRGVVVGIRSYGLNCRNTPDFPTISTRVSSYIPWITENA